MHINSYIDEQCIRDFLHTYTQTNKYKQFTTKQQQKLSMPMPFMILSVSMLFYLVVRSAKYAFEAVRQSKVSSGIKLQKLLLHSLCVSAIYLMC